MTNDNIDNKPVAARDDAGRRRGFLRQLLQRHNMRPAELARQAGLPTSNSLYNFLNGHSASLSQATIEKIVAVFTDGAADALIIRPVAPSIAVSRKHQAPPGVVVVPVIAEARLGQRQQSMSPPANGCASLWVPAALVQDRTRLFGVRVGRPGAEHMFPEGTMLICVALPAGNPRLADGERIVVTETHDDGIEVTVRRVQIHQSGLYTWPDTDDPRHQRPALISNTPIADKSSPATGTLVIVGKVIATLQPEPRPHA